MGASRLAPSVRIIAGEVQSATATTRLIIPSAGLLAWEPFERVGETVTNRTRHFPPHAHERQEVLTYVSEGLAAYRVGDGPAETVAPGSALLLSTTSRITHSISPVQGPSVRWFALVLSLVRVLPEMRLQSSHRPEAPTYEDTALVRHLVGSGADMKSAAGLECREIEFVQNSTSFLRVGHDRKAIAYALNGAGTVGGFGLEAGEGALIEGASGIAIGGTPGLRVIVATAPLVPPDRGGSDRSLADEPPSARGPS